ncbi:unnamed protein product [Rotaria sp. Silwood1]|nr:unnamed protein product [Rotaria sp. Silwood1]CAF4563927.1 unnamed protein product [Rotaria sp. Silwood1]
MHISISNGYNIHDRALHTIDHGPSKSTSNQITSSKSSSVNIDQCIPVYAVKELGCMLSEGNILFQGPFQTICEQHQLCYACGFAHSITQRQCNRITLNNMNELCFQNKALSSSDCMKENFFKLSILQQYDYQSYSATPGLFLECRQQCVYNYLLAR